MNPPNHKSLQTARGAPAMWLIMYTTVVASNSSYSTKRYCNLVMVTPEREVFAYYNNNCIFYLQ